MDTTTTVQQRLELLVKHGCIVRAGGLLHTVGAAAIDRHRFFFSTMFPEDQHHTHVVDFARVEIIHGCDLAMYVRGACVAYVAPWPEWTELDMNEYLDERRRWRLYLADAGNAARFNEFVRRECPDDMQLIVGE